MQEYVLRKLPPLHTGMMDKPGCGGIEKPHIILAMHGKVTAVPDAEGVPGGVAPAALVGLTRLKRCRFATQSAVSWAAMPGTRGSASGPPARRSSSVDRYAWLASLSSRNSGGSPRHLSSGTYMESKVHPCRLHRSLWLDTFC